MYRKGALPASPIAVPQSSSSRKKTVGTAVTPPAAATVAVSGFKKAILIGINYVAVPSARLAGCVNDAFKVRELLVTQYGFAMKDITVLFDENNVNPSTLPTRANIVAHIAQLVSSVPAGAPASLFVHYSGHGSSVRDVSGDEEDGQDEVLVPLDFRRTGYLTDDWLRANLVDPLPPTSKLTCLFDCCNSGTALDLRCVYRPTVVSELLRHAYTRADVTLISGCKDDQTSADSVDDSGIPAGALTTGFLKVLEAHKTGPVSYMHLMMELTQSLKQGGYSQIPQLSFGKRIDIEKPFSVCL